MESGFALTSAEQVYGYFGDYLCRRDQGAAPSPRERAVYGVLWHHIYGDHTLGSDSFTYALDDRAHRKSARDLLRQRNAIEVLDTAEILRDRRHQAPAKCDGIGAHNVWILKWIEENRRVLEVRLAKRINLQADEELRSRA